ncbi:hypothetical protein NFI96_007891 [Prochilodus magdalenae]|nr:hypothetical protein NFI96_007891 [Prochilodus magdalenae]
MGTNDICARQSEVLKEHYQMRLDTARRATNARIIISGPLPTYRKGCERFSRLFGLHSRLHGWCAVNGLGFVDNWSSFWEQPALYRRDGLRPSHLGSHHYWCVYKHGEVLREVVPEDKRRGYCSSTRMAMDITKMSKLLISSETLSEVSYRKFKLKGTVEKRYLVVAETKILNRDCCAPT